MDTAKRFNRPIIYPVAKYHGHKRRNIVNKKEKPSETCIREFLEAIGLGSVNKELKETPRRISDLYKDMTEGLKIDIKQFFNRPLPTEHNEMVVVKDIEFVSMCEHHFWPFFGKVHIAYIPQGRIVGLSKFVSAVRAISRRPQLQERMISELANTIQGCLKPLGCMVIVEGIHTCMLVGGRYDYGFPAMTSAKTMTSAVRGVFLTFSAPREEAMRLIYGSSQR